MESEILRQLKEAYPTAEAQRIRLAEIVGNFGNLSDSEACGKAHQQFCSKSHPQFIVITSDGTGTVNFKELFIYRFLQYIGYGPKVHFIVDRDIANSRVDEVILIATQDLGYTKRPAERGKIFQTFREVNEELTSY